MKHSLNREELIEQLKELAAQKLPTYLANHMGAMCYELEVICGSCALEAKEEAEFFDLPFTSEDDICEENAYHLFCFKTKSDKDYHQAITDMESLYDYQAVLAFLKGESYSIMDEQDTIKRMTGIGIKENDSNEE